LVRRSVFPPLDTFAGAAVILLLDLLFAVLLSVMVLDQAEAIKGPGFQNEQRLTQ